jgi:hypothetical protein
MTSFEYVSFGLGALSWMYWAAAVRTASKLGAGVRAVDDLPLLALPRWPTLSIVIPACNEGATLGQALTARLADDYPGLEIIVVDDRSTDATGAIADSFAARDPRVRVIHLDTLPDGWLGKLHAMQRGCELATGDYLLFSDADTHWTPGTLRRIVARCEAGRLDHLAVFPTMWSCGLVLDAATATITRMLMMLGRPWSVPDPRSPAALGVGAFNLVRRASFARTGGFEWLRLEVADDVALADMMKRAGGRSEVLRGGAHVGMQLYLNVREYARSAEKAATLFSFRVWPAVLGAAASLAIECAPLVLVPLAGGLAWWLSATALLLALVATASLARACGQRPGPALLFPLGVAMSAWAMLRAAILGRRQGGLRWRTTFYPAAQLLAGRRYRPR